MSDTTTTNLPMIQQWVEAFNHNVESLVHDLYAPDALLGGVVMGPEKFLRFERRVLAAAPERAIRVERTHEAGDVVVAEGVLVNPAEGPDWKLPFCAVLTVANGKIVRDDTYADFSKWPGLS